MGGLGAEFAIFGAFARLRVDDPAKADGAAPEMLPDLRCGGHQMKGAGGTFFKKPQSITSTDILLSDSPFFKFFNDIHEINFWKRILRSIMRK